MEMQTMEFLLLPCAGTVNEHDNIDIHCSTPRPWKPLPVPIGLTELWLIEKPNPMCKYSSWLTGENMQEMHPGCRSSLQIMEIAAVPACSTPPGGGRLGSARVVLVAHWNEHTGEGHKHTCFSRVPNCVKSVLHGYS